MKHWLPLIILLALSATAAAHSDIVGRIGKGIGFTGRNAVSGGIGTGSAPIGCASPTAPNGVIDLSQCSNAFYAAVIF